MRRHSAVCLTQMPQPLPMKDVCPSRPAEEDPFHQNEVFLSVPSLYYKLQREVLQDIKQLCAQKG